MALWLGPLRLRELDDNERAWPPLERRACFVSRSLAARQGRPSCRLVGWDGARPFGFEPEGSAWPPIAEVRACIRARVCVFMWCASRAACASVTARNVGGAARARACTRALQTGRAGPSTKGSPRARARVLPPNCATLVALHAVLPMESVARFVIGKRSRDHHHHLLNVRSRLAAKVRRSRSSTAHRFFASWAKPSARAPIFKPTARLSFCEPLRDFATIRSAKVHKEGYFVVVVVAVVLLSDENQKRLRGVASVRVCLECCQTGLAIGLI